MTFYALAIVFMLVLVRGAGRSGPLARPAPVHLSRETLVRAVLVGLGLLLGLVAVMQLTEPHENYWPIFWLWIAAIGLYLLGFARLGRVQIASGKGQVANSRWWISFRQSVQANGWEWGLVLLLLVGAFALRAWRINTIPWTLSGDEGNFGRWAREVFDGRVPNMFSTGHLSMPSMYIYFQALGLRFYGGAILRQAAS